jgi:uncharacterized membrane protein YfhO
VDGRNSEIFRANYAFRAVEIDAGSHIVEFTYSPWTTQIGIPLSFLAMLGLLGGSGYVGYKSYQMRSRASRDRAFI